MSFDAQSAVAGSRQTEQGGLAVPRPTVAMAGEIDLVTAPVVLEAILAAGNTGGVVVDFCDVAFVGVATVNVPVEARRRLRSDTGEGMAVRSPTRLLRLMLDLFDLADMIERGGTHDLGAAPC